ncbi:MFS transporter [Novosphingobium sp. B1]|uniref:MFS transporter n=1 Tax=Novosphingobium sp. B1 TaxID=1938756 RepID=UPI0009D8C1D6|nr:MFS transporter [Novosphingobium sp. B1]SMC41526.1 Major Facilitator Superfamily protein [Novosphingobium sp. B1]
MPQAAAYEFKPHERPTLPGSPANPDHPARRRVAYGAIGVLIGLAGGLGNALIAVNLPFAQGTLGLGPDEAAWLTAAYLMTNTVANLVLVKYRQQFGLQPFIRWMLGIYVVATVLHLFVHGFWSAIAVRAAGGLAGSALSTLTILYLMQAMPAAKRLAGLMIGISVPQIATPLARVVSPSLLVSGDWHMLYWFELGLGLASLAAILALPLPPSERTKAFEKGDALSILLLVPGMSLLIAVLTQGRIEWWTSRPWMGWALIGGLVLVVTAFVLEHFRRNPLINTRWLGTREMVRLIGIAAAVRILLSEQAFGSVGLLTVVGLNNEQMVGLNLVIIAASLAGLVVGLLTINPAKPARPFSIALVLIAIGAFMDMGSTNLTRPENFYFSQALIGFASILFLAQAMIVGLARTLLAGPRNFVSFTVLFTMSQSLGGLLGAALLGTFQVVREKMHSAELVQHIVLTDPQVAARIASGGRLVARTIGDPVLRNAQGAGILSQQVTREANILAFNDLFLLVGVLAVLAAIWTYFERWRMQRRGEESPLVTLQKLQMQAAAAAAQPSTPDPATPNTPRTPE